MWCRSVSPDQWKPAADQCSLDTRASGCSSDFWLSRHCGFYIAELSKSSSSTSYLRTQACTYIQLWIPRSNIQCLVSCVSQLNASNAVLLLVCIFKGAGPVNRHAVITRDAKL